MQKSNKILCQVEQEKLNFDFFELSYWIISSETKWMTSEYSAKTQPQSRNYTMLLDCLISIFGTGRMKPARAVGKKQAFHDRVGKIQVTLIKADTFEYKCGKHTVKRCVSCGLATFPTVCQYAVSYPAVWHWEIVSVP